MGLFGFLVGKVQQASAEAQAAQMEAERYDADRICYMLQNASSLTKITGYANALKSKCRDMSDWELKERFDRAYNARNVKVINAMLPEMKNRELAYKDENGKIRRNY